MPCAVCRERQPLVAALLQHNKLLCNCVLVESQAVDHITANLSHQRSTDLASTVSFARKEGFVIVSTTKRKEQSTIVDHHVRIIVVHWTACTTTTTTTKGNIGQQQRWCEHIHYGVSIGTKPDLGYDYHNDDGKSVVAKDHIRNFDFQSDEGTWSEKILKTSILTYLYVL